MKRISICVMLLGGVLTSPFVWADHHEAEHQHAKWFDSAACDICKPWSQHEKLMTSAKWETHLLQSGMLITAHVPAEQMETFTLVCKQMDAAVAKLSAGNSEPKLCGFCQALSGLMEAGAKMEKVQTSFGNVVIISGDTPELVAKIHEVAKRNQDEEKKMLALLN